MMMVESVDLDGICMSDESRYIGTKEAAEMLGVGESTVKRWVDQGVLPAERTAGRHRKIRLADLHRAAREHCLPVAHAPDVAALAERLHAAVIAGDHEAAHACLRDAHQGGLRVADVGDRLVAPVMARVGHGWATKALDVYEEHRATQACLFALLALRLHLPRAPGSPLALGGGVEGDHYLLANLLIEMTLIEEGWAVENVGPNTPWQSLCRAARERRPRLIWVSCSFLPDPEPFLAGYQTLHAEASRLGASVAVGGRALDESTRSRMAYSHFGDRLVNLASYARDLRRPPDAPAPTR